MARVAYAHLRLGEGSQPGGAVQTRSATAAPKRAHALAQAIPQFLLQGAARVSQQPKFSAHGAEIGVGDHVIRPQA
jgi:hypothetical protein